MVAMQGGSLTVSQISCLKIGVKHGKSNYGCQELRLFMKKT